MRGLFQSSMSYKQEQKLGTSDSDVLDADSSTEKGRLVYKVRALRLRRGVPSRKIQKPPGTGKDQRRR